MTTTTIFLRRSWIVLVGAIIIAAVVYIISKQISPTYTSTAEVGVLVSGSDPEDVSLGANSLASQYSQDASATSVLAIANKALGSLGPVAPASVSSGAVSAQNLIQIKVSASSAAVSQIRTAAVTRAFMQYVTRQVAGEENYFRASAQKELAPLNAQIASLQKQLTASGLSDQQQIQLETTLSAVITSRASAVANIAQTVSVDRPSVVLVSKADAATQGSPKPTLYALVGLIIGFLVLTRLVTLVGVERYRHA